MFTTGQCCLAVALGLGLGLGLDLLSGWLGLYTHLFYFWLSLSPKVAAMHEAHTAPYLASCQNNNNINNNKVIYTAHINTVITTAIYH